MSRISPARRDRTLPQLGDQVALDYQSCFAQRGVGQGASFHLLLSHCSATTAKVDAASLRSALADTEWNQHRFRTARTTPGIDPIGEHHSERKCLQTVGRTDVSVHRGTSPIVTSRCPSQRCTQTCTQNVLAPTGTTRNKKPANLAGFRRFAGVSGTSCNSMLVPRRGLEPPRFYPLVPETSASTNSATWAGVADAAERGRERAAQSTHEGIPCQCNWG
jgi:hypothetical protein